MFCMFIMVDVNQAAYSYGIGGFALYCSTSSFVVVQGSELIDGNWLLFCLYIVSGCVM